MDGMNKVYLVGNVAKDPILSVTPSGKNKLVFRMACTDRYLDKKKNEWVEKTEWVRVVSWGARNQFLTQYGVVALGRVVVVEGSLRTYAIPDKHDPKKTDKWITEVVANRIIGMSTRGQRDAKIPDNPAPPDPSREPDLDPPDEF